ncbi:hypothetical protein BV20DRAFT_974841 [Pilatotrama ljubarskyi]|nr:hypothetical protein BV20DRAFT_974841 [Pilatotrama ljubarskyi]
MQSALADTSYTVPTSALLFIVFSPHRLSYGPEQDCNFAVSVQEQAMAPVITYCRTQQDAARAASTLSRFPVLIVDCEARDLGMPGGALSLLALSDETASHIFLIDALAFPPCSTLPRDHPSLAPLLAILENPSITKVFWDGRADALELLLTYGITLAGALDLQLVEVVARKRAADQRGDKHGPHELINGYFKPMKEEVLRNPAAYHGIFRLRGLGHVVGLFQLGGKDSGGLKDPEVVRMHETLGSEFWMTRPLPQQLLTYAAHDLEMIAIVYAHFLRKAWFRDGLSKLKSQSSQYVAMFRTREDHTYYAERDLKRFMPFGIIEDGRNAHRYFCSSCKRELTADCFTKNVKVAPGVRSKLQRLSFCRLCNAIARKKGETEEDWIDF